MPTVTTVTVESSGGDYTSLNAAEAGEQTNLISADVQLNIECYASAAPDTTAVVFDGWSTDATRFIRVIAPVGERHAGALDTNKYHLKPSFSTNNASIIRVQEEFLRFEYIQGIGLNSGSFNQTEMFRINGPSPSTGGSIRIDQCIVTHDIVGSANNTHMNGVMVNFLDVDIECTIRNCLFYDLQVGSVAGTGVEHLGTAPKLHISNCTFHNCDQGITSDTSGNIVAKNCLFSASLTQDISGTFAVGTNYNSTDASSIGYTVTGGGNSNDRVLQTITFVDEDGGDFHIDPNDTSAKNQGIDLTSDADFPFTLDIDGETRSGTWDIGIDENNLVRVDPPAGSITFVGLVPTLSGVALKVAPALGSIIVDGYAPIIGSDSIPHAFSPTYYVMQNQSKFVKLLVQDGLINELNMTVAIVSSTSNGTLTLRPNHPQSYEYVPDTNFVGTDSFTFTSSNGFNTSNTGTVTLQVVATWVAPAGIPSPSFGIQEAHTMYSSATFDFGSGPESYKDAGNGPYTHYVDADDINATDTSNTFGTQAVPRLTIPDNLAAGVVVELHSRYNNSHSSPGKIDSSGTVTLPVFIRGADGDNRPEVGRDWEIFGSYIILEHLHFADDDGDPSAGVAGEPLFLGPFDHVAIRHSEISGNLTQGGLAITTFSATAGTDAVVYDCVVRENGDYLIEVDQDQHGITIGLHMSDIWVVDNEMFKNSGDGMQIGGTDVTNHPNHVYVGRNISWRNKQAGLWCKTADDVVFSENITYFHSLSGSSTGAGLGWQYDGKRIWYLFNHTYSNVVGINGVSGNVGGGEDVYLIGNLIHTNVGGPGIHTRPNDPDTYIINNTIYNTLGGIHTQRANHILLNNIISDANGGFHVEFETPIGTRTMTNCIFHEPSGTMRVDWESTEYNTVSALFAATGAGTDCEDIDPEFVNTAIHNYRLQDGSPAFGTGIESAVYATFNALYGLSIQLDIDGKSRPQGSAWDMGAYETEVPLTKSTEEVMSSDGLMVIDV